MSNVEKEVLEQTKGVAVELYKDALSPAVKPLGEVLGFLPRTLKLALKGWEKWLINGEESLRLTAAAIEEKVKKIPAEKLVEPESYIAIPAIQQISYCQNSEELRDMYANLLTSSMNVDKKWQVHPSFVDIIKQLNPDEAKYIKSLPAITMPVYPLIDVSFSARSVKGGSHPIISNFTDAHIEVLEFPKNICAYIDNLVRLNIIEIPSGQILTDVEAYKKLEKHPMIQNPVGWGEKVNITYYYTHKIFKLTNYGVNFLRVVSNNG